jgi:asparagine synthetase B (glutamine-hydrolysing)
MFTISNKKIRYYKSVIWNNYYFNHDEKPEFIKDKDKLLLFEGYLYPDTNFNTKDVFLWCQQNNNPVDNFKKFKGKFSGVFINKQTNKVNFFNDQLGLRDVFYYLDDDRQFIISNRFVEILKAKKFSYSNIDSTALNEFLVFSYPLLDRTFIKNIKYLPLASIYSINNGELRKANYWKYQLIEDKNFDKEKAIEKLDFLLSQSIERIRQIYGADKTYGLGLSGGYDSRLTAHYALKNKLKLKTFIWGNPDSDAYVIARKIAR